MTRLERAVVAWVVGFPLGLALLCCVGCTDSARHQFAYTEPAVEFHHGWLSGTHARASTLINGTVDVEVDPETQKVKRLTATLQSDPREVYTKQAERITANFLTGRQLEYDFKIEAAKVITAALNDLARSLVTMGVGMGGGPMAGALVGLGRGLSDSLQALGDVPDLTRLVEILKGLESVGAAPVAEIGPGRAPVNYEP